MGVLRGAIEAARGLDGIRDALERIAGVLERLYPPLMDDGKGDQSAVQYVDDVASAILEEKQEAYYLRTGRRLPPGVPPPSHGEE